MKASAPAGVWALAAVGMPVALVVGGAVVVVVVGGGEVVADADVVDVDDVGPGSLPEPPPSPCAAAATSATAPRRTPSTDISTDTWFSLRNASPIEPKSSGIPRNLSTRVPCQRAVRPSEPTPEVATLATRPAPGIRWRHVPQHPPAPQLRAARDDRRGARRRAPVRPQGQREHQAQPGQPGG